MWVSSSRSRHFNCTDPRDQVLPRGAFSENVTAKILRVATEKLVDNISFGSSRTSQVIIETDHCLEPPFVYRELVPQSGPEYGRCQPREVDFWISGFFPSCIYSILKQIKYPRSLGCADNVLCLRNILQKMKQVGLAWSDLLKEQATRTDTHV